jgi:uncharacterized protein (TIGR00251 family)
MGLPGFLKTVPGGVSLSVKVQPRASKNEIGEPTADELKIKVTAPPVDSAANEAVLRLVAETLDCPRGAVQLVRGNSSRHKQLFVQGLSAETVLERLAARD